MTTATVRLSIVLPGGGIITGDLRSDEPRIGERGACPDCGRPAHYVSHDAHRGWYHDVIARLEDP